MCYIAPRSTWLLTMLLTTRLSAGGGLSRKQRSRQKAEEQASQQETERSKQWCPRARPDGGPEIAAGRLPLAGREAETREVLSKVRPACPVKSIRHDTTYDISGKRERHDSVAASERRE